MTRRPRSKRSVERRLDALESAANHSPRPIAAASYDADAGEYRNAEGNIIPTAAGETMAVVPTDEELARLFPDEDLRQ